MTPGTQYYHLYLILEPIFKVWNPFNVTFASAPDGSFRFNLDGFPYRLKIESDGGLGATQRPTWPPTEKDFNDTGNNPFLGNKWLNFDVGETQPIVMRPGEVQIYSQGTAARLVDNTPTVDR